MTARLVAAFQLAGGKAGYVAGSQLPCTAVAHLYRAAGHADLLCQLLSVGRRDGQPLEALAAEVDPQGRSAGADTAKLG